MKRKVHNIITIQVNTFGSKYVCNKIKSNGFQKLFDKAKQSFLELYGDLET